MSSDKEYPVLSVSQWMGYIDPDHCNPDKTVKTVSFQFGDITLHQQYIQLPYSVESIIPYVGRSERIPMLAFLNTDWMPAVETLPKTLCSKLERSEQRHMFNVTYIANSLMKLTLGEPHIKWNKMNVNPYHILKDIVITSIPADISPEKVCKVCNDVIRRRYEELMSLPWL
jgi:hypothetical protein